MVTVQSVSGVPVASVTVVIRKLKRMGMTNKKGELMMKGIPHGEYVVEITCIGYEKRVRRLPVTKGLARKAVKTKQASSLLNEIVLKEYYTATNRLNTEDVTTVKRGDIQKQPVCDPILALEGRAPGLFIQQMNRLQRPVE